MQLMHSFTILCCWGFISVEHRGARLVPYAVVVTEQVTISYAHLVLVVANSVSVFDAHPKLVVDLQKSSLDSFIFAIL